MSDDRECEHVWILGHVYPDHRLVTTDHRFLEKAWRCNVCRGQVVFKPGHIPANSLMLHELSHAMGCWKHHTLSGIEALFGVSRHVMATVTMKWAALTVQDVDCITEGAFWDRYAEPDLCFVELTDSFDLIAPDALGYYTRLAFVGNVEAGDYRWELDRRVAGSGDCASVRITGGQIVLDDVRSMEWSGSAVIAPEGDLWRLVVAYTTP